MRRMALRNDAASVTQLLLYLPVTVFLLGESVAATEVVDTAVPGERAFVLRGFLGRFLAPVGDLNGDGFDDVATTFRTAINVTDGSYESGVVVVLGRPRVAGPQPLDASLPGTIWFFPEDPLWRHDPPSLSFVGDVNRDGFSDLWLGYRRYVYAPFPGAVPGACFLVYGSASLPPECLPEEVGRSIPGLCFYSSNPGDRSAGGHAAHLPDFDGDGRSDLAVSLIAASNLRGEDRAGAVVVISDAKRLPTWGTWIDLSLVGKSIPGSRIYGIAVETGPGERYASGFGLNLLSVGDLDGDGLSDLVVRAVAESLPLYLIRGRRDPPPIVDLYEWEEHPNITLIHQVGGERGLRGVAALGDLDGDGFDDFALGFTRGCCPSPFGPTPTEVVIIIYGTGAFPREISAALLETEGVDRGVRGSLIRPYEPYSWFGSDLAGAGDLNGDGIPDLLIGAPQAHARALSHSGEAYAVYGKRSMPPELSLRGGFDGIRILGHKRLDLLGDRVFPAGDFDGDGAPDFLVYASGYGLLGESSLYVFWGTGSSSSPFAVYSAVPASGPLRGGTPVQISGSGFTGGTPIVRFGERLAASVRVESISSLVAVAPPGDYPGVVELAVSLGGVTRRVPGGFEYIPDMPTFDVRALGERGFTLVGPDHSHVFALPPAGIDLGDLTKDGVDDLVVACQAPESWYVFVVRGGPDLPPVLPAFEPSPFLTRISSGLRVGGFDATVAVLGDVNGEGGRDVGIGLYGGLGYVIFSDDGLPAAEVDVDAWVADGLAARLVRPREIGDSGAVPLVFAPLGDLTGDGVEDFAIGFGGAVGSALNGPGGEVLLVAGRTRWPAEIDLTAPGSVWAQVAGIPGQYFGLQLAEVGDVDGRGFRDLIVRTHPRQQRGQAYVFFGERLREISGTTVWADTFVESDGGVRFEILDGLAKCDRFSVAGAGDVDADGYADVLIGVECGGEHFEGMTYLVRGGKDLPRRIALEEKPAAPDRIVRIVGEGDLEYAGRTGEAGDFNADGYGDFIVGAPGFQQFGVEAGNAFILFGGRDLPPKIALGKLGARGIRVDGQNPAGAGGCFVGPSGDLNGDALSDVAFSENAYQKGDVPRVYVLFNARTGMRFVRGDANWDGVLDISDAVFTLTYLFLGGPRPLCLDAADVDDGGKLDISDPISLLGHLFLGFPAPPPPYPEPGIDPTADDLECFGY